MAEFITFFMATAIIVMVIMTDNPITESISNYNSSVAQQDTNDLYRNVRYNTAKAGLELNERANNLIASCQLLFVQGYRSQAWSCLERAKSMQNQVQQIIEMNR